MLDIQNYFENNYLFESINYEYSRNGHRHRITQSESGIKSKLSR
jgi:hypothetical protein